VGLRVRLTCCHDKVRVNTRRPTMSIQPAWQHTLDFFGTPIVIEPSAGLLSSDAGLLPFRQLDERLGLTRDFAAVLNDPRDPDLIEHTNLEMVRSRVYGILAGYEDQNDHDTLRIDPVFKLLANRSPDDADLASQPTLSRFESQIDIPSLFRLRGQAEVRGQRVGEVVRVDEVLPGVVRRVDVDQPHPPGVGPVQELE